MREGTMIRYVALAVIAMSAAGCPAGDNLGLERDVVLDDADVGRMFTSRLSPDGQRIAFAAPVNGRSAIFVASADGSNPQRITSGVWDDTPHWSPDGQWIAYHAEAPDFEVAIVPAAGGESRFLTTGPANDRPTGWMPDGSGVVFGRFGDGPGTTLVVSHETGAITGLAPASGPGVGTYVEAYVSPDGDRVGWETSTELGSTIWVRDLPDGAPRQLVGEGYELLDESPWSPDGTELLYLSSRTGTPDIWVVSVASGATRQLTSDVRADFNGVWSPDGRWVAFTSGRGGQTDVWVVPAAGGQAVRVTNDLADETEVQWTRDGSGITYRMATATVALQAMPSTGGAARDLVRWEGYGIGTPRVSPDGSLVAFVSDRSGNDDLWIVPIAGGEPRIVAPSASFDNDPRWSPDGTRLAFVSGRSGRGNIHVVNPADSGAAAVALTDFPEHADQYDWSPDGASIAFHSARGTPQEAVWTVPAAGGEPRRLTDGAVRATEIRWGAGGATVYFVGDGANVYRVPATGGRPQALLPEAAALFGLQVAPDGDWVSYSVFPSGWGYLMVAPADGGEPRKLTTATEEVYHPEAFWMPDGSALIVRSYDYIGDTSDLIRVSWPAGEWSVLTSTPDVSEFFGSVTPDGSQVLLTAATVTARVMRVSVADVLP